MASFKKPSKKTAIAAGITAAIIAIVGVSGTAVYLKSKAQTQAADFDGNPEASQTVDVGTGEQSNGQETQRNDQSTQTPNQNNDAAINNDGGATNDGVTPAGTGTPDAQTPAGTTATTPAARTQGTGTGTPATPNNIQEVEIVDTQTNTVTFGTDGRYLSWAPMKVDTDGIANKTNAEIDNVKITKTTDKQKVKINEDLTYTITVSSEKELNGVEVKDKVPEFTTFKSVENGESVRDNNGNTWVRWYVDLNEDNGFKAEVKFTVTVNPEVTGKIKNAEAIANGTPIEEPVITPVEANILFEENGGTEVEDLTDKVAGDPIENREMPTTTRQGYDFEGWFNNKELTGDKTQELPESYPAGTTTYYAKWEPRTDTKYTVEFYYQKDGKYPEKADSSNERTGTTDTEAQVTDADKTATKEGYVFDEKAENVLSGNIAGDGSLVLKVYFKEQFKVTYKPGDHGTFTEQTKSEIDYGTATPGFDGEKTGDAGYTFTGWSPEVAETVTKNAEYVAQWKANEDTKYTVEYYYQKDGKYPEKADSSDERTGTTDTEAQVTDADKTATKEGYVFDEKAGNVLSGNIAGDGSLVLKVYFKEQFKVTYKPGDHGTFTEQTKSEIDYGTATPEFEGETTGDAGYTFTGWAPEVAETVTKNAEYVAQWKANEDTKYTVEFYYQKDGKYPEKADSSDERTGTTDTEAQVTDADKTATKEGYVFDEKAENVLSGNIAGDGSLVLKVYFKEQFKVTYKPGDHGTFTEQTKSEIDYGTATPVFDGEKTGDAGYTFTGWSTEVAETVTKNAEYVAQWKANEDTKYTVEYYYQKDGKYPEKADSSDERTGTTDTEAQVTDADKTATKEGYVFDEKAENVLSGNIAGDGSLVLKVYFKEQFKVTYKPGDHGTFTEQTKSEIDYGTATPQFEGEKTGDAGYTFTGWAPEVAETVTKNAEYVAQWKANDNTKYTVEYYYQKDDGTYPESTDKKNERQGTTDATVTVTSEDKTPETVTGKTYVFDEENKSNVLNGKVAGDGSLVLKVYFKQQYKVTYKPGDHGTFTEQTKSEIDYGTATPEFEGEKTGDAGYTFTGWAPEVAETVTKNAEYVAQWKANDNTKYTVEYYYQVDGNYLTTPDSKDERTGTTDTEAQVTDADKTATKEGYVFDEEAKNVLSGNIAGDGSLVLKVYFKEQFKVTYKPGTHGTFAEQTTNGLDYKANTPEFNGEKTGENGFYFVDWDKEVAKTVTENAEYTALWEGLEVTKTKTAVVDLDGEENATYVDQEGDIIRYTIEVKNVGDVDAENVTLKDDHNVKVTSIKINDKEVQVQNTNIINAGNNLLEGIEATIEKDKTMVVTVEYTATKAEIDTALAGDKKILNTATATLNGHDTPATDEGTEVKQRVSYTIEYYFNGVKGHTEGGEGTVGTSVGFTSVFEGYTYIEYIGIDNQKGGSTTLTEGTNLIKVYFGKPELDIVKEVVSPKVKAGDNIEYKITVTNTGYIAAENVQVTDELKGTTFVSSSNPTEISTNATTNNQVLTWNIESVAAATDGTPGKVEFTVIAKTPRDYIGKTIENTATIVGGKSSTVNKKLEEVNVDYEEWLEGKEGTALNIVFILDNSSSMNQTVEGETFANSDKAAPVAPGDRSKTRIENAKNALKTFIDDQTNKGTGNTMTVIKFNSNDKNYPDILKTEGTGYDVIKQVTKKIRGTDITLTEAYTADYDGETYTIYKGSDNNEYLSFDSYGTEYVSRYDNGNIDNYNYYRVTRTENTVIIVNDETITLSEKEYYYYGDLYTGTSTNGTNYVIATDGKAYKYTTTPATQGASVIGTTINGATTNDGLSGMVTNMTIGDAQYGYDTYVSPAFDLVRNYLVAGKTNVVVVLTDGEFKDNNYSSKASNLLNDRNPRTTDVDYIYSIAFGGDADTGKLANITNVYEKDENGNDTNVKKVYTASNSGTLLDVFNKIEQEANGETKNDDTTEGSLELDEASKVIKITGDTKVSLTDKDTGKVYECSSEAELAQYGLHLSGDKKTITWEANEFTANNPNETVPSNVLIKYFVGRN